MFFFGKIQTENICELSELGASPIRNDVRDQRRIFPDWATFSLDVHPYAIQLAKVVSICTAEDCDRGNER